MMIKKLENTNNTENKKDEIDYKKEIEDLRKQIMSLANGFKYLQDNLEKTISNSIEEKLKEKEKSEQETKKLVDILVKNSMENNPQWEISETNYLKNALDNYDKSNSKSDMIINIQDKKTGEDQSYVIEAKSRIKQNELFASGFVNDKWNNYMEEYCSVIKNISSRDDIDKDMKTKITKEDIENNPVKNMEEFMRMLIMIKPSVDQVKLMKLVKSQNFKENDIENYNKFLLYYYNMFNKITNYNNFIGKFNEQINDDIDDNIANYKGKNLLGEYMDRHGKRVAWLSKRTGISRSTLESIVRNPNLMPTVDKALKITKALNVDIEIIFPLEEENHDK